jgi:hypothetical protein
MLMKLVTKTRSNATLIVDMNKKPDMTGIDFPEPWDKVSCLPLDYPDNTKGVLFADAFEALGL